MTLTKKCWMVFLMVFILVPAVRGQSGSTRSLVKADKPARATATAEDVQALRETLSAQQKEIEQLKSALQRLLEARQQTTAAAPGGAETAPTDRAELTEQIGTSVFGSATPTSLGKVAQEKKPAAALQAGWDGNHFFVQSTDKKFLFQPFGYLQSDYTAYTGTTVETNHFQLRRARVGFTGKFGDHYEFGLLLDFGTSGLGTSGTAGQTITTSPLRDFYINAKIIPEAQFKFGQWILPFSQEVAHSAADLDFVDRSLLVPLYPSTSTFRAPGAALHGDALGGAVYYDVGAFNGKGVLTASTTNTPEGVARLGFRPWQRRKDSVMQGFDIYGAATYGHTSAINATTPAAGEINFSGLLQDRVVSFFPTLVLNGSLVRADGGLTYTKGPLALRAEYTQANAARRRLGPGSTDLPGFVGKGYAAEATYVLTGENRPRNLQPNPRHPFLLEGERGAGAWQLGFRYSNLQFAAGSTENRVDEFSSAINWFPTFHTRYTFNANVDRMKNRVGSLLPQSWVVLEQRLQFRF